MDNFSDTFFNLDILHEVSPLLIKGLGLTLALAALSVPLSILAGLLLALAQESKSLLFRAILIAYVDVTRAIPPLVLLILIFYGLPFMGLRLGEFTSATLALALNGSSYFSEIFRAGLDSVATGQREAARSTGLSWGQSMAYVILPQGIRNMLPDLISNTIELVKQTSIASIVALQELLRAGQIAQGLTYNTSPLVAVALLYFLMFWPFVRLISRLQNKPQVG